MTGSFRPLAAARLLLDEVAELPLAMQVKLLRAIQERRIHKVGSTVEESVDVRILSATHQDLARMVEAGRFRQDLFYRLNVIELRVPSLRERSEDIALIAKALLRRIGQRAGVAEAWLTPEAEAVLRRWPFPGNVRELENVLERSVVLTGGGALRAEDLVLETSRAYAEAESAAAEANLALAGKEPLAGPEPGIAAAARYALIDGVPDNLEAYLDEKEEAAIPRRAGANRTQSHGGRPAARPFVSPNALPDAAPGPQIVQAAQVVGAGHRA